MALLMDREALLEFLERVFPQALDCGRPTRVEPDGVELVLTTDERHVRPGGTISGPTMMAMADSAAYLTILSRIGEVALAVTTSLEIHFLRKPNPGTLRAWSRVLKLGRRLAVVQVELSCDGVEGPAAIATVTYAIPSQQS